MEATPAPGPDDLGGDNGLAADRDVVVDVENDDDDCTEECDGSIPLAYDCGVSTGLQKVDKNKQIPD